MVHFSVCTSVYKNDKPDYVKVALDSLLINQTVKPTEIVMVQDGPVLDATTRLLAEYRNKYGDALKVIVLEKNGGLGNALKIGVENARYDIIARMESDDSASPDRFEKQ